jgi:hypothetical protein
MLAEVVKPREANNNMDTIEIKDNSSASREASNFQQGCQQQKQGLTTTVVEHWHRRVCS